MTNKLIQKIALATMLGLTAFGCASKNAYTKKTDLYPNPRTAHCASAPLYDPIVGAERVTVNGVELQRLPQVEGLNGVEAHQRMSDGERILTEFYDGNNARAREAMDYIRSNNLQCPSAELAPRAN